MNKTAKNIYLDYSATTPLDETVSGVIQEHMERTYGNASSVHSYGRTAKVVLEESREIIAKSIGAETSEVFFTAGGTESDNHALMGSALAQRRKNGKDHLLVSAIEHHAVLECADYLRQLGFLVSVVPVDSFGFVSPADIEKIITPKTSTVSIMHANNETGAIQPIREISAITKAHHITFHSDTIQTIGKIHVDVNALGLDLLSISAHKIYGPKGVGAIYIRKGTEIDALLHGGAQERNNRAGTENIPLIAGFAKVVALAETHRVELFQHAAHLRAILKNKIQPELDGVIFNSADEQFLPHIVNVSLDASLYNAESESLLLNMDLRGVAVSSGSACTSGSVQPSHVLLAMGRDAKTTQAAIRFSFGKYTTPDEVNRAGEIFCSIVQSLPKKMIAV